MRALILTLFLTLTTGVAIHAQTLTMLSAVSRKTHGSAGTFDIPLSLGLLFTNVTIEPRIGGPTTIVFTFSHNISTKGSTLSSTNFAISNATYSNAVISTNTLTLNLTDVIDRSQVLVFLRGITDACGSDLTDTDYVAIRARWGNVNQDGQVTLGDMQVVKHSIGRPITAANFLCDINLDGSITIDDTQAVKLNLSPEVSSVSRALNPNPNLLESAARPPPINVEIDVSFVMFELEEIAAMARESVSAAPKQKQILEAWMAGKGKLLATSKVIGLSGLQTKTEGVLEKIYPTEYEPPRVCSVGSELPYTEGPRPTPGGFQTRNIGCTVDLTSSIDEIHNSIGLTIIPELSKFLGWNRIEVGQDEGQKKVTAWFLQPNVQSQRITTSLVVPMNETIVTGGLPDSTGKTLVYIFITARKASLPR